MGGSQWKAKMSYRDAKVEFTSPTQVEDYVSNGKIKAVYKNEIIFTNNNFTKEQRRFSLTLSHFLNILCSSD